MTSDPAAAARPDRPTTSPVSGALRVFDLSLGEMLWSRRTIFMALVVGAPILLAAVARIVQASGIAPLRVNGAAMDAVSVFGMMIWVLFLRFIVPVLGVFYGTSLIADEVEDKTITYLFTRPLRRGGVLLGKYLAYIVCTTLVVLPSVMIVYFLLVPVADIARGFRALVIDLGLLAIGIAAYGALFTMIGAWMKRPLVVGLIYVFGWEQMAMLMPGYLRRGTIAYYLQALVPHAMPADEGLTSILRSVFVETPGPVVSLTVLIAITLATLAWAMRTIERREYVLEQ